MITINSLSSVSVDGLDHGTVADTIANNRQFAADIQRALVAYDAAQKGLIISAQTAQATAEKAFTDKQAAQDGLIAAAKAAVVAAKAGDFAPLDAVLLAVTTPAVNKQRAALQQTIDEAAAALAALT